MSTTPSGEEPRISSLRFSPRMMEQAHCSSLSVLRSVCLRMSEVRPATPRRFEHPQRTVEVVATSESIGRLFEFHPRMVEQGRAAVLDLNLTKLMDAQPAM